VNAEFSCFMPEFDQVIRINSCFEDQIIVKIKDSVLTKKTMETLTRDYGYDSFERWLDDNVCHYEYVN
jgi:hypothetical protein